MLQFSESQQQQKTGNFNQIRACTTENVIDNNQLMVPFVIQFLEKMNIK